MTQPFAVAAAALLSDRVDRLPDLSVITVLVPHHHVRAPFLAALAQQLGRSTVFLPPRCLTLPALAASQAGIAAQEPDSVRLSALHGLLSRLGWLDRATLWPQAQSLHELLLEMDDALLELPDQYTAFAGRLEQILGGRLVAPLDLEARLVFDVWRAYQRAGSGGRKPYAERLARWSTAAPGPVYSLGLHGLSQLEQRFLERCRASVGLTELPLPVPYPDRHAVLRAAWRPEADAPPLRDRAAHLAKSLPESPLAGRWAMLEAADLEDQAQSVAVHIRTWLAEGRRDIAVVALDRLAARRLRAVLERDAILLQDETGWTFSTAAVSHVLDRWLTLLQDGFYHRDLLDLIKSAYLFGDLAAEVRLDAVAGLERAIAHSDAVNGLGRFVELAPNETSAAMLARLSRAADRFQRVGWQTLAGWLDTLLAALEDLGASGTIAADPAGRQLLELLRRLRTELAADTVRYGLAQWRGWLDLQLDRATFLEDGIESPIRLTHPAAARLRTFEAVIVLGGDAAHLPPATDTGLFNDAVRGRLGLPDRRRRVEELQDALIDCLSRADRVLLTWQARRGQEPNPASPWLLLLESMHRLAYGAGLRIPSGRGGAGVRDRPEPETASFPSLPALPGRLSASGWQRFVSCPYRFFAHYGLGLGEAEEVAEEMEKADYGELLHAILARFHARHPVLGEETRDRLQASLETTSLEVFRAREQGRYLARAWRLRWQRRIPAYLDWALAREAEGWRWRAAEVEYERELDLPEGRRVTLHGRLDRLDEGAGGRAVVDYKAQSRPRLRERLRTPGEDVQLPFYGLLTGAAEAGLVALDDDRIGLVESASPLTEAADAEAERIRTALSAAARGVPLPANGVEPTCGWCEMAGLCRKRHDFAAAPPAPAAHPDRLE